MGAIVLDGKKISDDIRAEIKAQIQERAKPLRSKYVGGPGMKPPCLAVILTSDDPASELYVKKKQEACSEVGITSYLLKPFEGGLEKWGDPMGHLLSTIEYLNHDDSVDGILVQLPLPKVKETGPFAPVLDQRLVFDKIDPLKDVDVFTPENVGLLVQGRPRYIPCTPAGIQQLLTRSGIAISGKKVAIINRSDVVGKPLHALLSQNNKEANATVTLCHDHTPPDLLKEICLTSDIIVVAVGKPKFLTADMVPYGAVVVDVGINRTEGSKKVVGDVDYLPVADKAAAITPVPGGVGPMTVTMLLSNTVKAHR
jgi:methylenetetrahydrofolate dehydrogenase (NADP+)/methenyltetrahydrofolate cyclohydrolase